VEAKSFSIGDSIRFGWETFKKYPAFFILAAVITGIVTGQIRTEQLRGEPISGATAVLGLIIGIFAFLVNTFVTMGIFNVSLKFVDGQQGMAADFISAYPRYLKYLGASILYSIAVAVGLVLLIIPGIVVGVRLQFFGFFILDGGVDSVEALRRSWETTRGIGWHVFVFDLALLGVIMLGVIALVIGVFVAIPVTWLALACVYRRLQPQVPAIA
jgi:uncharacterized membrane protein